MPSLRSRWLAAATWLVVAAGLVAAIFFYGESGNGADDQEHSTAPTRLEDEFDPKAPNVVVVMTDDQPAETIRVMPRTRRLIGDEGVRFENAAVTFPLCCPSRATFLTGQYAHNHDVRSNRPPTGGYEKLNGEETLPVWLTRVGYRSGFVGKYLNGYGTGDRVREVPPGWTDWYGLPGEKKHRAFGFELNENGEMVRYSGDRRRYKTDLLADKAVSFLDRHAPRKRPFFLWVATSAPHVDLHLPDDVERNPKPAPDDRGRFEGERAPRGPAFDEADMSDKPSLIRNRPRLSEEDRRLIDRTYVSQLESLVAVDRLVERVVGAVRRSGELERTMIVFTSDQGWMAGQHRIASGKSRIYEPSIRVPLLIRGPGFPQGSRDDRVLGNIDLAPTILDLAEAEPGVEVDDRSLLPYEPDDERELLLEIFKQTGVSADGLRTSRWSYAEYEQGDRELYDLRNDPYQLSNLAGQDRYADVEARLSDRVAELRDCAGDACR